MPCVEKRCWSPIPGQHISGMSSTQEGDKEDMEAAAGYVLQAV